MPIIQQTRYSNVTWLISVPARGMCGISRAIRSATHRFLRKKLQPLRTGHRAPTVRWINTVIGESAIWRTLDNVTTTWSTEVLRTGTPYCSEVTRSAIAPARLRVDPSSIVGIDSMFDVHYPLPSTLHPPTHHLISAPRFTPSCEPACIHARCSMYFHATSPLW